MKHSILIIGCGSIGERHLRCFQLTGRTEITACDSNAPLLRSMKEKYSVATVADWEQALASGQHSAAVVCTPAPYHVAMSLRALAGNINVLIEKPLSHSMKGIDELLRLERQSRAHAAVAYVYHVFPCLMEARTFLESGALGPIRQVIHFSGQPFQRLRPSYAQSYYRDRASGGGAIQDALTHSANWIESIVGPTESVLCDCAHLALAGVDVEDTVHIGARNGPVLVNYSLNQFQAPNESTFQINSERGSVKIELHNRRWGVWKEDDATWTWHERGVPDRDSHFIAQANAFLDQIEGAPPRLCSIEAAAQTLRFNLAALTSAESGARVFCHDIHN